MDCDKNSPFYGTPWRFNILNNTCFFDLFAVDIYYQKFCYIKYTINPIRKLDKNHNKRKA